MVTISEFVNKVGFKVKDDDVKKVNDSIQGIKSTATKLLGAIGIGFSLSAINGLIEEFGAVNNSIRSSVGEMENMEEAQNLILSAASDCRSTYSDMASTVSNLAKSSSDLFPIKDAAEYTSTVTKLLKTAGRSESTIASVMEGLNKSFQKGIVDTETLNKLLEQAPEAANVLANHLGVAKSQLLDMASNGTMKVADLKNAFMSASSDINASFENVDMTISDALTHIRNQWGLWLTQTDKTLGTTNTLAKTLVKAFNGAISILNRVRTAVVWLNEKLGGSENLLKTIGIVGGSILVALKADKIVKFIKDVSTGLSGIKPKTLVIIAAVILLALIVDDFVNFMQGNESVLGHIFDKMGINSEEIRQKITNVFKTLKSFLSDVWSTIKKILSDIWGSIKKIAESIWDGISDYFSKHGEGTKKSLVDSWESIKQSLKDAWDAIKGMVDDVFGRINETLGKHGTSIENIFNKIGEAVGFVIDVFVRLRSKIAEIEFKLLSDAVQICCDVFTGLVDIVCDAIDFFSEHKTLAEVLAIAIGTLTTAIIAYNAAQAIKNAGGIVEIAQLAATAIGVGALTAAETAHTVAATVATAVTTAFGAAVSFLTSPITLVILAIGALIAIIVVCVKHWDDIKAAASKALEWIKGIWSTVANWFKEKIIDPIVNFFTGLWDKVTGIFQSVIDWVKDNWKAIIAFIINPFAGIFKYLYDNFEGFRNFVDGVIQSIKDFFAGLWEKVQNIWSSVSEFFSSIFTSAWNAVKNVWSGVSDFFSGIWNGIKNAFGSVADWFSGVFSKAWQAVKNVFSAGGKVFEGIKDGIVNVFTTVVNAIIRGINKVIKVPFDGINWALNKIKGIEIVGFKPFDWISTINTPQIPELAEGGYVEKNKPRNVIIGDNKNEGEIVSPVSKMFETVMSALKYFASSYIPTPITTAVATNSSNITKNIVQNIEFNNQFNGDKAIQKEASKTMSQSADDVTAQLARGIAAAM